MATAKIPVSYPYPNKPSIPVTIINPKNKKSVTVNMLTDTGWEMNQLQSQYARMLGFTDTDILVKKGSQNEYAAQVKIGNLRPIETRLNIATGQGGLNVFGVLWMRQYDSFVITRASVTATDSTTGGDTLLGYVAARRDWNKYIHAEFPGPRLAPTTPTVKKQALFAASRSNSSAYWRNRI
jgi:hypothetical protein